MKKRIFSLLLVVAFLMTAFTFSAVAATSNFTPITGREMQEKLGLGINISNTLEAGWVGGNTETMETSWGEAAIQKSHFEAIAAQGFDSVRIPVTWEYHIAGQDFAKGAISSARMNRVQEAVDWALEAGLFVIINTHHEREFPNSLYRLIEGGQYETAGEAWINNVWGQIAERFKNYDERLIFEPMNEPHLQNKNMWIWDSWTGWPNNPINENLWQGTNHLNQHALSVIRASGGNNDRRVIITTVPGGNPVALRHYVHPTHNGDPDIYSMVGIYFYHGDEHAWSRIVTTNATIPVIVRETSPCGPDTQSPVVNAHNPAGSAIDWTKHWYGLFAAEGIPNLWWNPHSGTTAAKVWPRFFDRGTNTWVNQDLMQAYFNAYGRTVKQATRPPVTTNNFPFELAKDGERAEGGFYYWGNVPPDILSSAGKMVVEYTGPLAESFTFTRFTAHWAQWLPGDSRITTEQGRLTFDIRNIEGIQLGFGPWDNDFTITRVFLDTWSGATVTGSGSFSTADALTILRAALGIQTLTASERTRFGFGSNQTVTTADALLVLKQATGL